MSVIGPRPSLWNQDLLTAERDKYGANDVRPGVTGWAQINGRDELEIPVKAQFDGEYVKNQSFVFDMPSFFASIIFLFQALFLRLLIFRLELYSVMVSLFCLWRVWGRLQ